MALGATREARFPVPVFGPEPVGLPFAVVAKDEEKAAYERAVMGVAGRVSEARQAQNLAFSTISRLIQANRNDEALTQARAAVASADTSAAAVLDEVKALRGRPNPPPGADELLASVGKHVDALREIRLHARRTIDASSAGKRTTDLSSKPARSDSSTSKGGWFRKR